MKAANKLLETLREIEEEEEEEEISRNSRGRRKGRERIASIAIHISRRSLGNRRVSPFQWQRARHSRIRIFI